MRLEFIFFVHTQKYDEYPYIYMHLFFLFSSYVVNNEHSSKPIMLLVSIIGGNDNETMISYSMRVFVLV